MPLYKINREELVNDFSPVSKIVITKIITYINRYNLIESKGVHTPKLFINLYFMGDLFDTVSYAPSPMSLEPDSIVGKLAGVDVYISDLLNEHEIFIGHSEREIGVLKRSKKINKILERC
jgi:hypothetical protein